jgi:hypothetical protein
LFTSDRQPDERHQRRLQLRVGVDQRPQRVRVAEPPRSHQLGRQDRWRPLRSSGSRDGHVNPFPVVNKTVETDYFNRVAVDQTNEHPFSRWQARSSGSLA